MNGSKLSQTQKISNLEKPSNTEIKNIISDVYNALNEKGYNPVTQIVGYILSGDPTYVTGHNNARSLITKVERDELLEEIVNCYLSSNL